MRSTKGQRRRRKLKRRKRQAKRDSITDETRQRLSKELNELRDTIEAKGKEKGWW